MKTWILVRKGIRFNQLLEASMIIVIGIGLTMGAVFHNYLIELKSWVTYIFAYMTFATAVGCSSKDFLNAFRKPGLMLLNIGLLHLIIPIIAFLLSLLFLGSNSTLRAGIILGTTVPIGVAATIWTGIAGGNIPFALTTVILDTILSPIIVPLIMLITIGKSVQFDAWQLMLGLVWMIVLPTFAGVIVHDLTQGKFQRQWGFIAEPSTKIFLALVVSINLAVAWSSFHLLQKALPTLMGLAFMMSCLGYILGFSTAKLIRLPPKQANTLIYTVGIRNVTAGLVMALKYFPILTAIPVVFATIFQQPLAAVSYRFLVKKPVSNKK